MIRKHKQEIRGTAAFVVSSLMEIPRWRKHFGIISTELVTSLANMPFINKILLM